MNKLSQNSQSNTVDQAPETLDMASVPPFLRVLLLTDGTVTKSLEAYFAEPIRVVTTAQSAKKLHAMDPDLLNAPEEEVVVRSVDLVGAESQTLYAHAESLIRMDLLPDHIAQALAEQKIGVGELIRECGLETFRDILALGSDESAISSKQVWRSYRIVRDGLPFIKITETFPTEPYLA